MKTLAPCDHDECPPTRCTRAASDEAVVCKELLGCVESDLAPIKAKLTALSEKYRDGGEDRIGWEILQSIRALDEATHLAGVYLSGTPLPTLAEMRGIFRSGGMHDPIQYYRCPKCQREFVAPHEGYTGICKGCEQPND